jgi:2,4-dienoyl-CoA reductase-like NADH-dependent reductase (Old Yellow Enzyme family)
MTDVAPLFTPFDLGGLRLPNRFVMAPMTRTHSPSGVLGDDVVAYYRRRAEHGVGLIITEGTTVDHDVATYHPDVPRFHGDEALSGWKRVVTAVHEAGGHIMPQLWHVGTARRPGTLPFPELESVGPSGLIAPGKKRAREMTESDIANVIRSFATAAHAAEQLGFDGVELHGAHGYLIDQFFWDGTNERQDAWGNDTGARSRFATEIVRALRREVSATFPVVLRFSQWKQQDYSAKLAPTPEALAAFLEPLVDAGVDCFHASTRRFWIPEFDGSPLNLAGWTKRLTGKPVITVGSVGLDQEFLGAFAGMNSEKRGLEELIQRFEAGEFDLVAIGRALLQDPAWVEKVREGRTDDIQSFDATSLKTLF